MRALRLERPGPLRADSLVLRDLPDPVPGPGEILVDVSACGVCRTDLHIVEGEVPARLPVTPGHQVVGRVAAHGPGASRFEIGARVGAAWLRSACGACAFCVTGRENLCPRATFHGCDADGGYAERLTVPEAFAYRAPDGFGDEAAAPLLCAGIVGWRAIRLADVRPGMRVGLWGFGASAHISIQVLRHLGCAVHVFTRGAHHAEEARALGAAWVGRPEERPPAPLEAGIVFAPAGDVVPGALERLAPGATLSLAGIEMTDVPPLRYRRHLWPERTVRSVANATRRDGEDLLRLAAEIPIRTETTVYPLEHSYEALADLKASRLRGAAVLVL